MQEFEAKLDQEGRLELPADVQKRLGVRAGNRVLFRIEDGQVTVIAAPFTVEEVFGSVEPLSRPEDFEARIRDAKEERVERILREMRGA